MSDEYTSYSVHGSQLRYAKSVLDANGIPVSAINRQGDTYIIVIPAMYAGFDHHSAPQPHRSKPWWMPNKRGLVTLAMIVVIGFGAWMVLSGGITIKGVSMPKVDLPTVEMPKVSNPLADVQRSLDQTAASVNRTVDAAKNAAITFTVLLGSLFGIGALWAARGPLGFIGRGLAGAVQTFGKVVKRG